MPPRFPPPNRPPTVSVVRADLLSRTVAAGTVGIGGFRTLPFPVAPYQPFASGWRTAPEAQEVAGHRHAYLVIGAPAHSSTSRGYPLVIGT